MEQLKHSLTFIDGSQEGWRSFYSKQRKPIRYPIECVDILLRGIGQVVFMNNSISGFLILFALCYPYWWACILGVVGLITTTSTAFILGVDMQSIRDGLQGYNGFLVGLALGTFVDNDYYMVFPTIIFSVLCCIIQAFWVRATTLPACTLPFCVAGILMFLGSYQYSYFPQNLSASLPEQTLTPVEGFDVRKFFEAFPVGVSQIFLNDKWEAGLIILFAMLISSRPAALLALCGSIYGTSYAFAFGVARSPIYAGLWGYNPALSAIGIGCVFFQFSPKSCIYAFLCCILTDAIHASLLTITASWGVPVLTFPFNFGLFVFLIAAPSFSRFGFDNQSPPPNPKKVDGYEVVDEHDILKDEIMA